MLKTELTELFGIKKPIIQGGMAFAATPQLVAAVAEAGGLGILPCVNYQTEDALQEAIEKTFSMTTGVWGLNIGTSWKPERVVQCMDAALRNKIPIVETSGARPDSMKPIIEKGVLCYHKVPAVKYAGKLKEYGYAAVATVGWQAGGHPGAFGTTSEMVCQEASDRIGLPVIMGGGVYDGRGLAAALAYGASAVLMGTRFLASEEAEVSQGVKSWIINAKTTDTLMLGTSNPNRVAKNSCSCRLKELEQNGIEPEELAHIMVEKKRPAAWSDAAFEEYLQSMGMVCGLIGKIESCADIINGMVLETEQTIGKLSAMKR